MLQVILLNGTSILIELRNQENFVSALSTLELDDLKLGDSFLTDGNQATA